MQQYCSNCRREKPEEEFFRNNKTYRVCNDCINRHYSYRCPCNRQRSQCKIHHITNKSAICIHNRRRVYCVPCRGKNICEHSTMKDRCRICHFGGYLKSIISSRIRSGLKSNNTKKSETTIQYLGCNIAEFKSYIEKQFTDQMSWDNYTTYWEFDHIIPICYNKNTTTTEELIQRLNYTNIQPLEVNKNRAKRNIYIG